MKWKKISIKREKLNKAISIFINYLILSLTFMLPYLISKEISVVYATSTAEAISINVVNADKISWSVIDEKDYFYLLDDIILDVVFSGIGSSSNIGDVKISYILNGNELFGECDVSGISSVSVRYTCILSSIYSTLEIIQEDDDGNKYIDLPIRVYYKYNTGAAWENRQYEEQKRIYLKSEPEYEDIYVGIDHIEIESPLDLKASYYIGDDNKTYCKITSLYDSESQVKINITTNYPNPDDEEIFDPIISTLYLYLENEENLSINLLSSCEFNKMYSSEEESRFILEYTCTISSIEPSGEYFVCANSPKSSGDVVSKNGKFSVKINQNIEELIDEIYSFNIRLENEVNILEESQENVVVVLDHEGPFLWSVIPSEGYYYMKENIPIRITFSGVEGVSISDVKISSDISDYQDKYPCTYESSDDNSISYYCTLPRIYGSLSYSIVRNKEIPLNIRVDYKLRVHGEEVQRSVYDDIVIVLDDEYDTETEIVTIDNIDINGRLDLIASAYISKDLNSYCKIVSLKEYPEIYINVSTNYLNPNDISISLDHLYISYPDGEFDIPLSLASSCSFVRKNDFSMILTYRCRIDDIKGQYYKLCANYIVSEGSILPYLGALGITITYSNYDNEHKYSFQDEYVVEISSVVESLNLNSEVSSVGEEEISCVYNDNSNYCAYLGESKELKKLLFDITIHNFDPSYEIESFDLLLNIDESLYGSEDDFYLGSCELIDRYGTDVIYECGYYLPLMIREDHKIISYEGILTYLDENNEEKTAILSGDFALPLHQEREDIEIFYFISNYSIEETEPPKISFTQNPDGTLNCYVDPRTNKCYFGEVDINGTKIEYPLFLRISGYVFSNLLLDEEKDILNVSFRVSTQPGEKYSVSISTRDCTYEEYIGFKGIYEIQCIKDLSKEEPFINGIIYDPKNPPVIEYEIEYATGFNKGETISVGSEQTQIEESLLEHISTIDFEILDIIFTKEISDKIFKLSPALAIEDSKWKYPYPVCRIPTYIGKYLGEETGCDDNDLTCIISNMDSLSREEIERAYCKFDSGIWFIGKIDGIYNKSNLRFLTARYYLGDSSNVVDMSIAPKVCLDRSYFSNEEKLCDVVYNDGSSAGNCIVIDEGKKESLLLLCPFEYELGKVLPLDTIPTDIAFVEDPLVISISVEDNGYLRNGTDVYPFKYIIENSYNTITYALNTFKQESDKVKKRISELKDTEKRMLTVLGVITGADVAYGAKYRPSFLSFLPGPSLCLIGCLPCWDPKHPGKYKACVASAFKNAHSSPSTSVRIMGCGKCVPLIDAAFSCTLAGSMLIGKSLVSQVENYRDKIDELDDKIMKLQELLSTAEEPDELFSYTSYIRNYIDKEGSSNRDSFGRSWEAKLFMEDIPDWAKFVIAAPYGIVCARSMFSSAGSTADKLGLKVIKSAAISMGLSSTLQWIYTGKINIRKALISGVIGGIIAGAEGIIGSKLENIGDIIKYIGIARVGGTAIISIISGKLDGFCRLIGNFFLGSGIGMAIQGGIEALKETPDILKITYDKWRISKLPLSRDIEYRFVCTENQECGWAFYSKKGEFLGFVNEDKLGEFIDKMKIHKNIDEEVLQSLGELQQIELPKLSLSESHLPQGVNYEFECITRDMCGWKFYYKDKYIGFLPEEKEKYFSVEILRNEMISDKKPIQIHKLMDILNKYEYGGEGNVKKAKSKENNKDKSQDLNKEKVDKKVKNIYDDRSHWA